MTLALQITAVGPVAPTYPEILAELQSSMRSIFGSDIDIDNDSQDGQLLGIFAQAIYDTNQAGIAVYNSFSPATAFGVGLSNVVKINGIARQIPTTSTVDVTLIGQAGTVITDGIVADTDDNQYLLPTVVVIPLSGEIVVTATAVELGAIDSPAQTVTTIVNPQVGWQSVNNDLASVNGAPLETDAALRRRQSVSTMIPANTILEGILGSIAELPGVTEYTAIENDHDAVDPITGLPGHSVAIVIQGGNAQDIAETIASKKSPGTDTVGSITETVYDAYNIPHFISFYRPTVVPIKVALTVKALTGFTTIIETQIAQAIVDYINGLTIGQNILVTRLYVPANLNGGSGSLTYEVQEPITIARSPDTPIDDDITLSFHEQPSCVIDDVAITVVT